MKWWIGCSGFDYQPWLGAFYPEDLPRRKWFEYYTRHFNTVELNVTFYRFPALRVLQSWYQRSPADFRFTVKAPRQITHYKRWKHVGDDVRKFYERVAMGLQDKLGTVLFQLHPRMAYTPEHLEQVVSVLDPAFANVLEFRHASWWNDTVRDVLRQHRICFCSISYPQLPDDVYATAPFGYYRFHGVPELYRSSYTPAFLQHIYQDINQQPGVTEAYAYFNNDIEVHAVWNAQQLMTYAGVPMPVI